MNGEKLLFKIIHQLEGNAMRIWNFVVKYTKNAGKLHCNNVIMVFHKLIF